MFLTSGVTIGLLRLGWTNMIMQNHVLHNYADSLVKGELAERIQNQGLTDLGVVGRVFVR